MMVRNRLNLRVDTGSLTRLIHGSGMIRVALSGWWPVSCDSTPVGIPARNICRGWLSRLPLIRQVFWIWLGKKLQIFLMINLLISATATRRVIDVMIAAHVGCRWFVSHTRSRNMVRSRRCGNIRAQTAPHCGSGSNFNPGGSINVQHATPASSLVRGSERVGGWTQHHQVIALGCNSGLRVVIALTEGRLVVVGFFIQRVISR